MSLPKVVVELSNGNLGRVAPSEDGMSAIVVSGVAVVGKFALGDVLGPFFSPDDAVAKGIDAAYDTANTCMAYQHIKDFYEGAGNGTELYVMVVAKTVTMTQICDKANNYAAKLVSAIQGRIRMLGITRVPDGAYTPTYDDQLEADLWSAVTKAQALAEDEFTKYRPARVLLEGRNWQGNASSTKNLRDPEETNANRVHIVIGADNDVSISEAHKAKYAALGSVLGAAAKLPVQRNLGRVKNGKTKVVNAGFSNGALYSTLTDANLDTLNDFGYIFFRKHAGKDGFFFNDDHAACPLTDDYYSLSRGRTIDKAARITRQVYLEELLDDVQIDPATGRLSPGLIKTYQGNIETEINRQMTRNGEIVKVSAFVDAAQDILSNDKISTELNITPKGNPKVIKTTLGFENPANQ